MNENVILCEKGIHTETINDRTMLAFSKKLKQIKKAKRCECAICHDDDWIESAMFPLNGEKICPICKAGLK